MPTISILVPTFNRADKLLRLLKNIDDEITDTELSNSVHVLISNNASADNTKSVVLGFNTTKYKILYFEQKKNLGFDGNVKFLYEKAYTDYVWLFADDDILLAGAIRTVLDALKNTLADGLLFSFIQPPSSKVKTFNFPEQYFVTDKPKEMIRLIARYPKISIYIFRKVKFSEDENRVLQPFLGNSYYFVDLYYSVMASLKNPRLCVISKPLASCDNDFSNIRFGAQIYLRMYSIFEHPFVLEHLPCMLDESRIQSYYGCIQLMFSVKMGSIKTDDPQHFDNEIRSLEFKYRLLMRNPRAFIQYLLLKFKLVGVFKIYKFILIKINNIRRIVI